MKRTLAPMYRVYVYDNGPKIVDVSVGVHWEEDRFAHPDFWLTKDEATAALDSMAWIAFPWICTRCHKTRRTAAGTGHPAGWRWIDVEPPEPELGGRALVCGACGATP